jgi:hypothetical protein
MGRFATAAIIALALAGAAVESHADGVQVAGPGQAPAKGQAVPVEQLLADAADAPAAGGPALDAQSSQPGASSPGGPMGAMPPLPPGLGWAGQPDMRPDVLRGAMWRLREMEQTWGLFFNQRDKNLSDSDVQVLAQAILLVHGNHSWKVVDVADAADGQATFAYATADGSVIARFEINRHSGRVQRIG